ncbi:5-carboxymethyl-2-hydroxymuconate isomerase [Paraburkholderia sp. CNPSo 3155]|uniref:fumarylacetoacetate hydrolase family protein n=1 Tax=Paraburkholderia atlantica TaxID=2654982 RepID=UPI00128BC806|nr:fumarylacetoacetate hydrolase family protein [Paraburkholderia atlantica]MBB5417311.1 2-keto-4-pentenoate hydratase/2-oxohepta-3-ene-1,7-dioic acid hydratase in catechol pathway [Paraburkholderia atlantica]MPW10905.1 5-carboxymethyl-2-hydroxymuconate isomerase [Paraburkholderia atlantica]
MKLVSFERQGRVGFGAVIDAGIVDLGQAFNGRYVSLKDLLAADAVGEAAELVSGRQADFQMSDVTLLPVIPDPGKIWCCGLNYHEHVQETNREVTEQPTFFLRVASSQVGHEQAIVRPRESTQLDFEAEIAVVIGKGGRRIAPADAPQHIAGYACYNDGSVRDWQRHTSQWIPGKNFWRTGGFGPWMVTADEIPFDTRLKMVTRLNGQEMQNTTTDMMIHSIAKQIAYVSTIAPLEAGDVIVTGTPGGVGARRHPPVWMKAGDVVEIDVERIGVLRNPIADEQ